MNADDLTHGHYYVYLQTLDFLLFEEGEQSESGLGGKGHYGDGVEDDGEGVETVGEGVVEEQVLGFVFSEVYGRVVGLVGVKDGVDLASEAGLQLDVHELHHPQQHRLHISKNTCISLKIPLLLCPSTSRCTYSSVSSPRKTSALRVGCISKLPNSYLTGGDLRSFHSFTEGHF